MAPLGVLARLELTSVRRSGTRRPIIVEMGQPEACESGEWKCSVKLTAIDDRTRAICGEDALQAICLALRFIACGLDDLLDDGGKLLDSEGGEFPLDAYFGKAMLRPRQSNTEDPSP